MSLKEKIDEYCAKKKQSKTKFGREVMGDPCFVFDLEKGRNITLKTLEKVESFMAANDNNEPGDAA